MCSNLLQVLAFLQHPELQEFQSNPTSKSEQQYLINNTIKKGAMRSNQKEACLLLRLGGLVRLFCLDLQKNLWARKLLEFPAHLRHPLVTID